MPSSTVTTATPTLEHGPDYRGVAFRCVWKEGRIPSPAQVKNAIDSVLPGWDVFDVPGLPEWFRAFPASGESDAGPPEPMNAADVWSSIRKLVKLPSVLAAEPLVTVSTPTGSRTIGLRPDEYGLWGWPYDNATVDAIAAHSDDPAWHLGQTRVVAFDDNDEAGPLSGAIKLWRAKHDAVEPGTGVRIALIDTGILAGALATADGFLEGATFIEDEDQSTALDITQPAQDANESSGRAPDIDPGLLRRPGHGTATASIIVGVRGMDGEIGESPGIAPGVEVLPLRVSRTVTEFDTERVSSAVLRAVEDGAHVISITPGSPVPSEFLRACITRARDNGAIVIAGAGDFLPTTTFPAAFPEVVAVAATHAGSGPWRRSGLGRAVDIAAPGEDVPTMRSRVRAGKVEVTPGRSTGTSLAAAHVAGIAALWLSFHGGYQAIRDYYDGDARLVPAAFQYLLAETANSVPDFASRGRHGVGIVDARAMLERGLPDIGTVRRFESILVAQSGKVATAVTGVFTGWREASDDRAADRSVISLAMDSARTAQFPEDTEAIRAVQRERKRERVLLRKFLGEDLRLLGDEFRMRVSADGRLLHAFRRWRPGESLLPLFDLLIPASDNEPAISDALRVRLKAERDAEARRQRPIYSGTLPPNAAAAVFDPETGPAPPATRMLRAYAFDPSQETNFDTLRINQVRIPCRWERLHPGPVGEYLEVVDIDPPSGCAYAPIDLNHPHVLAQDGLAPSEGNPQFHQQMVYAVAMNTIGRFEMALGRPMFWSAIRPWQDIESEERLYHTSDSLQTTRHDHYRLRKRDRYVQRLRIYPHALREANAYYSPAKRALLFGYFPGSHDPSGKHFPGGMVFTCLSHDIIVHEVTHALMDGIHPNYALPDSGGDTWAFHEAFADIIALFQHFTYPEVLRHQIAKTRGDLETNNLLAQLAQQFGQTTGHREALRSALGVVENGVWQRRQPDPRALERIHEPHERGSILVAAAFDAFLKLYNDRSADLIRISTGGTGVLQPGQIHPDLVNRLAHTAARVAEDVLMACIRALDYLPPVDIVFGEFLRALVTADYDRSPVDRREIRVAFIDAFRSWGIYPRDVMTLSEESLRWRGPEKGDAFTNLLWIEDSEDPVGIRVREQRQPALAALRAELERWQPGGERGELFSRILDAQAELHQLLQQMQRDHPDQSLLPGLDLRTGAKFNVSNLRLARRIGAMGEFHNELIVEVVQQLREESGVVRRGGATLVVDLMDWDIRYIIYKRLYRALPDLKTKAPGELVTRFARDASQMGLAGGNGTWMGEDAPNPAARLEQTYADRATGGSALRREPFSFLHGPQGDLPFD